MLESQAGYFTGGGVDLVVIVAVKFIMQDAAYILQRSQFFEGTSADDAILEPAVGALHFALGLRRESIGDIHLEQTQDLSPLRVDIVSLVGIPAPGGVTVLDETENP
jgi:hypothetical protein